MMNNSLSAFRMPKIACLLCAVLQLGAQARLRMGDEAPHLDLGTVVQGDLKTFTRGRATVIEFWAVSCATCVANIPHLNELAHQFKGQPIDFISIDTYENAQLVRSFLQTHVMEGTVATDGPQHHSEYLENSQIYGATSLAYGISSTPVIVLVSRVGRIAAISRPSQVTSAILNRLLSGKPLDLGW